MQGKRVLVVDDNATTRQVLIELLHGLGLFVVTTDSGFDAIEIINSSKVPFDYLLLDSQMQNVDAFAIMKHVHEKGTNINFLSFFSILFS